MSPPYERLLARLAAGEVIVLDGATGTELQRRGAPMDRLAWCGPTTIEHERLLTEIHLDYVRAGADVITANTFASSRLVLEPAGYGTRVAEIAARAVEAAFRARDAAPAGRNVVVGGSVSHMVPVRSGTGKVDLAQVPADEACLDAFHELCEALAAAGVDHLMLEMMYHPVRARLALEAALATGLPVWFGTSARRGRDGRPVSFHHVEEIPLEDVLALLPATGVDVAGVMHTPVDLIADADALVAVYHGGPRMAYPDSGYFEMPDWVFDDELTPDRLEASYRAWIASGIRLIGGCCGLTVAHVEAAARARDAAAGRAGA